MRKDNQTLSNWWLAPVLAIIGLVPLLVRISVYPLSLVEKFLWRNNETHADFFNKIKADTLMGLVLLAILVFLTALILQKATLRFEKFMIPLSVYTVMVILSSAMARYREMMVAQYDAFTIDPMLLIDSMNLSLRGFWERYEGMYVLLGYVVVFFITYFMTVGYEKVDAVAYTLIISAAVIGVISIFQYLGMDFLQSGLGKWLMLGSEYSHVADELAFNFGKGYAYGTLYNPNYLGGYMGLILPIGFSWYLKNEDKRCHIPLLLGVLAITGGLISSNSNTGIIAATVAMVTLILLMHKSIFEQWRKVLLLFVSALLIFTLLNVATDFRPYKELTKYVGSGEESEQEVMPKPVEEWIEALYVDGHSLTVSGDKTTLRFGIEGMDLSFYDGDGNLLNIDADGANIIIDDERYGHYQIMQIEEGTGLHVKIGAKSFQCYFEKDGIKVLGNGGNLFTPSENLVIPSVGFEGRENFGSGRGYLWSRTIPIIRETIFVGVGADMFAAVFPQHDLVGKMNIFTEANRFPDKPHSTYLQMAVNTGLISLIAFLVLVGIYVFEVVKLTIKKWGNHHLWYIHAVFAAIMSYGISSIANDSVISISVVFWVLLGAGFAMNTLMRLEAVES